MASGMSDRLRQGGDLLGQQPAAEEGSPGLLQKFVPLGTPPRGTAPATRQIADAPPWGMARCALWVPPHDAALRAC
jgi:hypothetical protein